MTGLPTSGKMSVRIRPSAMMNPARIAINATITPSGRVRAAKTRRIVFLNGNSLADSLQERLNIPAGSFNLKKSAPHIQTRDGIVNLSLNNESLCLCQIIDRCKARLMASFRLIDRDMCRPYFNGRICRDLSRSVQGGLGLGKLLLQEPVCKLLVCS